MSLRPSQQQGERLVEYHVIWKGRLVSGWIRLGDLDRHVGFWEPGSTVYLLDRCQDAEEGVWRVAKDQAAISAIHADIMQ